MYKAALPSGLKLESETTVTLNTDFEEPDDNRLKEREWMLLAALGKKSRMTVQELEKESGMRNILPTLRVLLEREAVCLRTVEDELPSEDGNLYSFDVPTRR